MSVIAAGEQVLLFRERSTSERFAPPAVIQDRSAEPRDRIASLDHSPPLHPHPSLPARDLAPVLA